jgi:CspA family cold shock protein
MTNGLCKWFNESKGFGFISANEKEYFVHYKEIKKDGYKTLKENEQVRFEPGTSDKGLVARNVYPGYEEKY